MRLHPSVTVRLPRPSVARRLARAVVLTGTALLVATCQPPTAPNITATKLAFTSPPGAATAGASIGTMTVEARDNSNRRDTKYISNVTLAIANNAGSGTLSGNTTVPAVAGIAIFSSLSINKSGTGYTLQATAGSLTAATSTGFDITAGPATKLVFNGQPTNATAGAAITVMVTALDAFDNIATSFTGTVTLALGANPGSGTLGGTLNTAAASGVATFNDLSINKSGIGYTLNATATSLTTATSNAFTINAGAATQLAFTGQPSTASSGVAISPAVVVTARDAQGNTATSFTGQVTVAIANNAGSGSLSGTAPGAAVAGVAAFSNLQIDKVGTGYTLSASATSLVPATSAAFDITPGAAAKLAFTTQPTNAFAGARMASVAVTVFDAFNNIATNFSGTVAMAITAGTGTAGAILSGSATVAAIAGVATYATLSIDKAGSGYMLRATAGSLTDATSSAFNISVPPPAYVTNNAPNTVTVIATATNTVDATVAVGTSPDGVAITPDGAFAYVANGGSGNVSVIATASNVVVATVSVSGMPLAMAIAPDGVHAYVASQVSNTVSVIATATNTVVATIPVGSAPTALAITPDGAFAYVTEPPLGVAVISTATNTVVATVAVPDPFGVAITPDGAFAYVTGFCAPPCSTGTVSVIATATNTVVATVGLGVEPYGVAITPDGAFAYVTNLGSGTLSVIATATNTVVATVTLGLVPLGVAIRPDGVFAYVANEGSNTVSVIATATNTVVATVSVGSAPRGVAITPRLVRP